MVTDGPARHALFVRRFSAGVSVFFLCAGLCAAQEQILYWPQDQEAAEPEKETVFWRTLALELKTRLNRNPRDKNLKISFLNTPLGKHAVEDLMAYTLSGDGAATIQMRDTLEKISVLPEELYWMGQFLFEHGLDALPDQEPDDPASAEFRISIRVDDRKKTIRLYNSRNTRAREILWQYLYSFGQRLEQDAGLSDRNKPIMPVCRGVTGIQEIDADNDGLIDWLKLKIEFYAFRSGDFTLGFCGRKTDLFLSQGNSAHYLYINACLLKNTGPALYDYSRITIGTTPLHPKGPYVFDLDIDAAAYAVRADVRASPDMSCIGAGPVNFTARVNQEVVMEMSRQGREEDRAVIRFTVKEVKPEYVIIGHENDSITMTARDPLFLHDIECMGCVLGLVKAEGGSAVFEAGWIVPDPAVIENKIEYFNEVCVSDSYRGDKDQARLSLDNALACKEAIANTQDLRINIVYTAPAE